VKELHATLNGDEFLMWLINFRVVPQLMTRNEAMEIFNEVEEAGQIKVVSSFIPPPSRPMALT
jgi:hypothetical protein